MIRALLTLTLAASVVAPRLAAAADDPTPLDRALERYWGETREPPSLKWRLHPRAQRAEIAVHGVMVPDDPFRMYFAPGLSVTYFLAESMSLGVHGTFPQESLSDLGEFLENRFPSNDALYREEQLGLSAQLELGWLPFYGKMSALGFKFAHFDLGFYAGAGLAQTTFRDDTGADSAGMTPAFSAGVGFRFHPVKYLTVRLDYRERFVMSRTEDGGLMMPSALSLGIGTMFPYPEDRP